MFGDTRGGPQAWVLALFFLATVFLTVNSGHHGECEGRLRELGPLRLAQMAQFDFS